MQSQPWRAQPAGARRWSSKCSPSKRICFYKRLGIDAAEVGMHLSCKGSGNVLLFSVETEELGNHEENVTKSSVGRRHFISATPSLYPQTDVSQGNLSTAKPFFGSLQQHFLSGEVQVSSSVQTKCQGFICLPPSSQLRSRQVPV